jgi:hypothetical protein
MMCYVWLATLIFALSRDTVGWVRALLAARFSQLPAIGGSRWPCSVSFPPGRRSRFRPKPFGES